MNRINEIVAMEMQWTQPNAWKMNYVLQAGDLLAATLEFESSFHSRASAVSADGHWIFDQRGFWQNTITVENEYGSALATYKKNVWKGGGVLELANGQQIVARANFMQTGLDLLDEQGSILIHYQIGGMIHASAEVSVAPQATGLAELPWLVIFGWYLVVIMRRDSAAAAAAT
jgi:hypothetical protein